MHAGFSMGGSSGPSGTASGGGDDERCMGSCTRLAGQEWSLTSQDFKCLGFCGSERRTADGEEGQGSCMDGLSKSSVFQFCVFVCLRGR